MEKKSYLKHIDKVVQNGPYNDNWASLSEFEVPNWFKKAKFGIFIHWGVFSVPAFSNEWYSRNMYEKGRIEYEHHLKTYGNQKDFGYKDFIPMFTAKNFDADKWCELFRDAGAKYVMPVAEHHDGFAMYDSELSIYNAKNMGPKRDVLNELKHAIEKNDMTFCTSSHRAEHWWFMGSGRHIESDVCGEMKCGDFYWPASPEWPGEESLYSKPYPTEEYLDDWLLRCCELIDKYQPKILYFDWWIQHEAFKSHLQKLTAYYYNQAYNNHYQAGICYKHDAMMFNTGIVDVERGKFADCKPYYWQTDTAITNNSWCYTSSLEYKTSEEIICYLIDIVSKNGNLLLNVGPKADGTITDEDTKILKEIGSWLKVNGEGIYNSKVWSVSAEGPTKEIEGKFSEKAQNYTSNDIRFTTNNGCIYAYVMKCPNDGNTTIVSLADTKDQNKHSFHGIIKDVVLLGFEEKVEWTTNNDGLHIHTKNINSNLPIAFKIILK